MLSTFCFRCICLVVASSVTLSAAEFDAASLQEEIYATVESVTPAVALIQGGGSVFSGVIVSKEGHVLSAGHAVRSGVNYDVLLPSGRRLKARGKGTNRQAECALLQITSKVDDLPYVQMGESETLVGNQPCLSISFPSGQGRRRRPVVRFGRLVRLDTTNGILLSTAAMEPGDSGGPLFDLQGRVIGIHSRIGQSMDRNLDIPIDVFRKYWNELNREQPFTHSGPTVPTLGFQGAGRRVGTGVTVDKIDSNSLAGKHGIRKDDVIEFVYGMKTTSIGAVSRASIAARDDSAKEVVVKLLRGKKNVELTIPFDLDWDAAPEAEFPDYEDKEFLGPKGYDQLVNLPKEFSDLESELDDACVEINSTQPDGEELSIVGTRVKSTRLIISKDSMVGENPTVEDVKLEVLVRDLENDLVLLKARRQNKAGVDISMHTDDAPRAGSFLITPDLDGPGFVSVVGTKPFNSRKPSSRGFLGVMPEDYEDKGGAILKQVNDGSPAKRAGLKVGDVVIKLNETAIEDQMAMRNFLETVGVNATVKATITRNDKKLEKAIRLGPIASNHTADKMDKSVRREGFSKVITHDANLKPEDCGGPVFDLNGNFVGLNIARNSRVRSYFIPSAIVKKLVETKI